MYMCLASTCTTDGLSRAVTGSPTRNQPGAYLAHTPKSPTGTFLASPLLRTLGGIYRDPIFLAIPRYMCLANACIVVRPFRVVIESPARDESGAYLAHIPKSSVGPFLAHTPLRAFIGANAEPISKRYFGIYALAIFCIYVLGE